MTRLISAPWVLPITEAPIADGAVVVDANDTLLDVGPRADLVRRYRDAVEDRADGVLLPALVNTHCHLELSALAGAVPGGDGLITWATQLVPRARALDPARATAAATAAAVDMALCGTAAVGDVGNGLAAVPAIAAAGLRGVFFHELVGSREARPGGALDDAARELDGFLAGQADGPDGDDGGNGAVTWPTGLAYVPAPHAPYSVGRELFRKIFHIAARTGVPTTIHVAEDRDEIALLRDGGGRWPAVLARMGVDPATRCPGQAPVAYLASLGAFDAPMPPLLVHMVHAGEDDRRRARDAGATVVLCARSNLHITGELPDVAALRADGVLLALGTDSLASAPDLSLWGEMATLAARFPDVPASAWLDAATRAGAEAMGLHPLGSLTPGKRPGVIEVVGSGAERDPAAALVSDPRPTVRWRASA
ncbi:MAG TPA: amidohydrolase family protein [Polyangia bacterium]|nr:amidohydrolase family protein [Polyangia bacterium]